MTEKVVFDHVIKSMFTGQVDRLSPAGLERIKRLGIDPTVKLLPAYPATTWAACTKALAEELYPGLDPEEATRRLAHGTVDTFASDFVGRAMFGLLKLIGAERIARRMTQNFRSGSNYIDTKLTRIREEPLTNELWINDVTGLPGFYLGLLQGGMHHSSGNTFHIELVRSDGVEAVYHLTRAAPAAP